MIHLKICVIPTHYRFLDSGEFPTLYTKLSGYDMDISMIAFSHKSDFKPLSNVQTFVFPLMWEVPWIGYPVPMFHDLVNSVVRLIEQIRPDIVHTWDYEFLPAIIPFILRKKGQCVSQIISTDSFPGLSWRWGNTLVDEVAKLYTWTVGRKILLANNAVVVYSQNYVSEALTLGIPRERTFVIPPGVDTTFFNPDVDGSMIRIRLGLKDGDIAILFVGRLSQVKLIPLLFQAAKRLVKSIPNKRINLTLVGEGPYRTLYEKQIQDAPWIRLVGYQKNVREWIAASDIVVLPSLSEGVPNVILEAGACGKPVVASKVGGIPDVVRNGVTGFLVEPKNEEQLYDALKQLIMDDSLREEMGKNARKHIDRLYSSEQYAKNYAVLYDRMLS